MFQVSESIKPKNVITKKEIKSDCQDKTKDENLNDKCKGRYEIKQWILNTHKTVNIEYHLMLKQWIL